MTSPRPPGLHPADWTLRLVRQAGERVRRPRLSATETDRLIELYGAGMTQKGMAELLGRSPSAVWHCLRRAGLV